METVKTPINDYWNKYSDKWYEKNMPSHQAVMASPKMGFPMDVYPLIQKYIGDLRGKKILVPSSGDNVAAFGFHLLGAKVTSCDLSENQISNATKIAKENDWDIEFIIQDTMLLDAIKDNEYDLVYTSNGAHIWINDMLKMYRNINRVLKKGGYSLFFETHPMCRPFDCATYNIKVTKHYSDVFIWANEATPNFLWRTQDFVNAIVNNGFILKEMLEFHSHREDLPSHNYLYIAPENTDEKNNWPGDTFDWKNNPWAALPQCLCLCSQKV